jgi:hypothetical protein
MKLQSNSNGAWKNITPFVEENSNLEALRRAHAPNATRLRICDGLNVVWFWDAEKGWYRPRWYRDAAA